MSTEPVQPRLSRFAQSDDDTSFPGRRASREDTLSSVNRRPLVIGGMSSGTAA